MKEKQKGEANLCLNKFIHSRGEGAKNSPCRAIGLSTIPELLLVLLQLDSTHPETD